MGDQTNQPDVGDIPKRPSSAPQQWRSIINQMISTQKLKPALERRDILPGQHELSGIVPRDGDNQPSVEHTANGQPAGLYEQVSIDRSERHRAGAASLTRSGPDEVQLSHKEDQERAFILSVHSALIQQLGTHGIILTLLASITFVVFLQPPGSLDSTTGYARSTTAVQCFLFFSSVSFTLACTGLLMVGIASASLFRPKFFPNSEEITHWVHFVEPDGTDSEDKAKAVYDTQYNICRVLLNSIDLEKRLRIYMAVSFIACIVAFIFAGLAITESSSATRNILIAGICVGGSPFIIEALKHLGGVLQEKYFHEARLRRSVSERLGDISPRSLRDRNHRSRSPFEDRRR